MKTFVVESVFAGHPLPDGWPEQLTALLGAKPRRMGEWAQMALYGALSCVERARDKSLLRAAGQLVLLSRRGTKTATTHALAEMQEGLPMPLTFLQTQPSQLLASLVNVMGWQGGAVFLGGADPVQALWLVSAQIPEGGAVLLGVAEVEEGGRSDWLLLRAKRLDDDAFGEIALDDVLQSRVSCLSISAKGLRGDHVCSD